MSKRNVAIIGGGAAGFFTAVNLSIYRPDYNITIYEASSKVLSKVLISGGGRCNVTNRISDPIELSRHYPRGRKFLINVFKRFTSNDTKQWFKQQGVELKTEEDGRVFPVTNSSQTIYNCLVKLAEKNNVQVKLSHRLTSLKQYNNKWILSFKETQITVDTVVLCTGCSKQMKTIVSALNINYVPTVPSLFTFNAKSHHLKELSGISCINASVQIKEITKSAKSGPLLITHWGYSGPSILRLSAWFARELAAIGYIFTLQIKWNEDWNEEFLREQFTSFINTKPKERISNWKGHNLSKRLWITILTQLEISTFKNWSEIGKKGINKLIAALLYFEVPINGKSTFKAEFVTAGGIELKEVDPTSFAIKKYNDLYAAGELLNIDAITGGFNFQAAWSGAYCIANSISNEKVVEKSNN